MGKHLNAFYAGNNPIDYIYDPYYGEKLPKQRTDYLKAIKIIFLFDVRHCNQEKFRYNTT